MEDEIIQEFYSLMYGKSLTAYGILDSNDRILTLGTDSKIVGRIFEMITQPILEEIANRHNMILRTPSSQTVYPDFIMMTDEQSKQKIAIDVKSTYLRGAKGSMSFTLGSFASYMRDGTKNIEYEYNDYIKHYVIGFAYRRNDLAQESRKYDYENRHDITLPYNDVRYFMQEKYKISGDKPGSGDTENIGSIKSADITDFIEGRGPFSQLGQDAYDIYWKYYPTYRSQNANYTSISEFIPWYTENFKSVRLLHNFDEYKVMENVSKYK